MSAGLLEVRDPNGVTWLTFDRTERLNAFTGRDYGDLREGIEGAVADAATPRDRAHGLRSRLLGGCRSFVAGRVGSPEDRELASTEFGAMLGAIDGCDKPVIAAVNGLAVGIGCTILLHCDLVLVADSARLRFPFTALGVVPEAGSSALLPTRARWSDAVWAMLSSEWLDAHSAVAMGLAWRAVADAELIEEAERAAVTIAALDPRSVAATKRLLVAGRADLTRAAIGRELAEMAELFGRRTGDDGSLS